MPVVHVTPHRDRGVPPGVALPARSGSSADPHASEERAARERAERALESARETVHHLQTRLGHAELALREAVDQDAAKGRTIAALRQEIEQIRAEAATARLAADEADAARLSAESLAEDRFERQREALAEAEAEIRTLRDRLAAEQKAASPAPRAAKTLSTRKPAVARRVAPKPVEPEEEPEPVKWWLPSPKKAAPPTRSRRG